MATETQKTVEDSNFKPGVMSPNSKQAFAAMRKFEPVGKHKIVLDENTFESRFLQCQICKERYNHTERQWRIQDFYEGAMRKFEPVGKHKIVLDENTFESRFLQCQICKERYNHTERVPRILPCHHCFCLVCVMDFYWRGEEERRRLTPKEVTDMVYVVTVTCPTCNNSFVSTHEGLQELVTDHRIIQLLDFIGTTDKHSIQYCPKHCSQPLNFFCERCSMCLCRDCLVIDHKQCSNDKMVLDIQNAFQKYDPALVNGVKDMEEEVKSLSDKKEECKNAKTNYKRGDEEIVQEIKDSFEKIRKALQEREEKLIEMAREAVGVKEYDFDKKMAMFESKEGEVKDVQEVVQKGTKSTDIIEKYKAYLRLKRYTTEPAIQKEEYENKQDKKISFNNKDEVVLTAKISNYGEVESKSSSTSYSRSSSLENSGTTSSVGSGSSYMSSLGSYSGAGRTSSYSIYLGGSSLYSGSSYSTGSSYSSRYTPTRSYRY